MKYKFSEESLEMAEKRKAQLRRKKDEENDDEDDEDDDKSGRHRAPAGFGSHVSA